MYRGSQAVPIDPELWRACAGTNVNIPEVGSKVYYFPEGHAEQCDSPPALHHLHWKIISCCVLHVRYFIDQMTDELSAAISLQQVGFDFRAPPSRMVERRESSRIESFMKVLTQSDANNGGGFSVPRQCAESIFPPLNYQDDPPVQNLTISDVQGGNWHFRHIYRGKPKRHLLTTGWSKFVNHKKLIGGDTIVFMRHSHTRKMYIGVRRLRNKGSNRRQRSRMYPRFVEEAAMHAAQGLPFEVVIYPKSDMSDFVVNADLVDRAFNFRWAVGMRVKMDVPAEDPSRRACLQGHVSFVKNPHECRSLWKLIQVTWIEPEHLHNVEMLNPWQVECIDPPAPFQRINSSTELIVPHTFHPQTPRNRELKSLMGQRGRFFGVPNRPFHNTNVHLTSMEGVRHFSEVSSYIDDDTHRIRSEDMHRRSNMSLLKSRNMDVHHAESVNTLLAFGAEVGKPCSILSRGSDNSIQLFGKHILIKNPVESQARKVGGDEYEDKYGMELTIGCARATPVEGN